MTTGSLGQYMAGWAPLYVVETTSKQMGVYRIQLQETIGKASRPKFELLQIKSYAEATTPQASAAPEDQVRSNQGGAALPRPHRPPAWLLLLRGSASGGSAFGAAFVAQD